MAGETDHWTPYLFRNTTQIFPWLDQPSYNLVGGYGGYGLRRDPVREAAQRRLAEPSVLRPLCARRHARLAPTDHTHWAPGRRPCNEMTGWDSSGREESAVTQNESPRGARSQAMLLPGGDGMRLRSLGYKFGLVEIAARAGSRIECLFLDEGFGALDPTSLDTALDALESAARRGRRIAAVTHVDAVTARADQVLAVSGSDSGSHVDWRRTELGAMV